MRIFSAFFFEQPLNLIDNRKILFRKLNTVAHKHRIVFKNIFFDLNLFIQRQQPRRKFPQVGTFVPSVAIARL